MWREGLSDNHKTELPDRMNDFDDLLLYITDLAQHKLGYPVSLLTYLGVVNNEILGIEPNSLANILLNNVGDPFKDSETSLMEVKKHEREIIMILERYYGLEKNGARGYVTTGGTEGNFAGLWWSKRYLINCSLESLIKIDDKIKLQTKEEQELIAALAKIPMNDYQKRATQLQNIIDVQSEITNDKNIVQQLLTPTVFYSKGHTHYSIPKISEILRLNIRPVMANADGSIDLNSLKKELLIHMGAHPQSPVIVIANIGTTITGAIDNVPGIKKILEDVQPKIHYTIHMDGALTGFVIPILKPFGEVDNYFDAIGVNTLAVSAHKYPGLSQPCGIILARKTFFDKAFEKSERSIDYVGNILDVTITGSRSGLNVLMFYNALRTLELHKHTARLKVMIQENLETAKYLHDELVKIFGQERVSYPYHFNVIFPRPSLALAKKYQLMLTGDNATICVLTNVSKKLIDQFIHDLKLDIRSLFMTKTTTTKNYSGTAEKLGYKIRPLTKEYMIEVADLFVKTFCDSEPITKHLGIQYHEYEPFAMDVIQKAVNEGMGAVILDKNNKVIACTMGEDLANPFVPNFSLYPKMKPIFALLDKLSEPFLKDKKFTKGKIAHVWVAMVDDKYRGQGLSIVSDRACIGMFEDKGYLFTYAEFTNDISEKIIHHYSFHEKINSIKFEDFTYQGQKPFKGLKGSTTSYLFGSKPGLSLDTLEDCYIMEKKS